MTSPPTIGPMLAETSASMSGRTASEGGWIESSAG
jgi:hypothetical protein